MFPLRLFWPSFEAEAGIAVLRLSSNRGGRRVCTVLRIRQFRKGMFIVQVQVVCFGRGQADLLQVGRGHVPHHGELPDLVFADELVDQPQVFEALIVKI